MERDMTQGKPFGLIMKFGFPLFLGNIFQQLYNAADSIIVSRYVGNDALAAVGSTGTIMFLIIGFAQGITTGCTVLTSQRFGAKNEKGVRRSVANAILLAIIIVFLTTLVSILAMNNILTLMRTPKEIFDQAYTYITIICGGLVALVFYNLFSAFLRAVGNSMIPLVALVFSSVLNVILDLTLIKGFHMGVAGAAIATVTSQGISAILCLIYIIKNEKLLWPKKHEWYLELGDSKLQLGVGLPMAIQFAITASGTMVMQAAINNFGVVTVSAFAAASKLHGLMSQAFPAMGQAMATYSGQNYGKGNIKHLREGVKVATITSTIMAVIMGIVAVILVKPTMMIYFRTAKEVADAFPAARTYIMLSASFYVPLSYIFIFRNTMQGCGYAFLPLMGGVVELVSRACCGIISVYLHNQTLAFFCDSSAWITTGIYAVIAYKFVIRDILKRCDENQQLVDVRV
ncbi:MATE family efflux transporter [Lachnobacterium bovis]|uniref:Putative efflux protein, MATE family n=1 Tax=Lachnobacterium bovis TaxID=140626 RepID=A0A1H9P839_9FIRM|nr:MATE family efflux transporter [Lachnobacterium bovis]SER44237.1 putative efflux protein, MATE family [Lachnobacterium bovis]